jgi:predicted tellurium resistance membrane protein TerC
MKDFALGKENFILIAGAVVLIIIGFAMMSGGASPDEVSFNPGIFNQQRIVVAPIVTVSGFVLVVIGILRKQKGRRTAAPASGAEKKKA